MPAMLAKVARRGFNVPKASFEESIAFRDAHSSTEILAVFDDICRNNVRDGLSKVTKPTEGLVDHLIHHQDIRRPLGTPRLIPEERLVAALEVVPHGLRVNRSPRLPTSSRLRLSWQTCAFF